MSKIDASSVIKKLVKTRIRVSSFNGNVKSTDGQYELANSNNADSDAINVGVSMFPKSVQQQIREHSRSFVRQLRKLVFLSKTVVIVLCCQRLSFSEQRSSKESRGVSFLCL